jgi:hypothetical protein
MFPRAVSQLRVIVWPCDTDGPYAWVTLHRERRGHIPLHPLPNATCHTLFGRLSPIDKNGRQIHV